MDLVYCGAALLPLRLVLSGMKEVTRTWKVLGGVTQAHSKYKDSLLVMIAIGWAKGQSPLVCTCHTQGVFVVTTFCEWFERTVKNVVF